MAIFSFELLNSLSTEVFKSATGHLFTDAQIKAVSSNAIGRYFSDLLPEPNEERAARERVEEASHIIAALNHELGTQTQQLDVVLQHLEEKKQQVQQYQVLATVGQEQFDVYP